MSRRSCGSRSRDARTRVAAFGRRARVFALAPRAAKTLALAALAPVALVLAVLPLASASAADATLQSHFSINREAAYTNSTHVRVGDRGWSPFFTPAVLVWDGGSIIGSAFASPGFEYHVQTTRLLHHPCQNYISASPNALLADMLAEAPTEVDARYRPTADANICLVMAGAGDILAGNDVNAIYAHIEQYCVERRSAGFRVVVVTLLPRSSPLRFERDRLDLNAMVRANWQSFADGLADVATDDRIGDSGDNLNLKYYRSDGVHPTEAGFAVMAADTAPVLNALEWHSDECEARFSNDGATWTDWYSYAATTLWELASGDGTKTVYAEYRGAGGEPVALSDTIRLDTVHPRTYALRNVSVRRGDATVLPYLVTDARPCGPTATVAIRLKTLTGSVRLTLVRRGVQIGVAHKATFRCWLPKGTYRYYVYARDSAGNPQARLGAALLAVH